MVLACGRGARGAGRRARARRASAATVPSRQRAGAVRGARAARHQIVLGAALSSPAVGVRGKGPPQGAPVVGSVRNVSEPSMRTMHLAPMPFSRPLNGRTRTATLTLSAMATLCPADGAAFFALGRPGGRWRPARRPLPAPRRLAEPPRVADRAGTPSCRRGLMATPPANTLASKAPREREGAALGREFGACSCFPLRKWPPPDCALTCATAAPPAPCSMRFAPSVPQCEACFRWTTRASAKTSCG